MQSRKRRRPPPSKTSGAAYLVGGVLTGVWEVKRGREHVDKLAVHSLLVNVLSDQLADKVLPCAGPSVQREHQGLLRVLVVHESVHRF